MHSAVLAKIEGCVEKKKDKYNSQFYNQDKNLPCVNHSRKDYRIRGYHEGGFGEPHIY